MKKRDPLRVKPTRAVPSVEVEIHGPTVTDVMARVVATRPVSGELGEAASNLDRVIASMSADLAVLERAREILARGA